MNMPLAQNNSQREFLIFFYKYRVRLLIAFIVPFLIAVGISFVPSPRYKAESVLIVRLGSEYVYQPEVGNGQGSGGTSLPFETQQIFKSEVAILSSEDLHRQVINAIGIETLFPDLVHPRGFALFTHAVNKALQDWLKAFGMAKDEPLSPEQAEQRRLAVAMQMFDKNLDIMLEKESAVINVSYEHKDSDVAVQALNKLLEFYFEKRKDIYSDPRADLAGTQMKSTHEHALEAQHAVEEYKLKHKIYSLEDQRRQLLEQRSEAQRQLQTISSPILTQRVASYNYQLDQLDVQERAFNSLQKEADIANDSYALYSHKLDEAKAFEDVQHDHLGSVRVIQPPVAPPDPKKMQMLIIITGTFIAFGFSLMVAALTEFSRRGYLAPEQIERTIGLPVLAVIPHLKRM